MTCFLCKKTDFVNKYKLLHSEIFQCTLCGIFIKKILKQPQNKLYDKDYYAQYPYSHTLGLTNRYFRSKIRTLQKLIGKSRPSVLDIGCGWGDFGIVAKGESLPYFGIDGSPTAIQIAKNKNLFVENTTLKKLILQKKQFDAIVSFQTLEHVKNPHFFLNSARQLLRPGGIILLTTPNNLTPLRFLMRGKWSVYNTDSHFVFYDTKTLRLILEKNGFTNIEINIDSLRFFTPAYILKRISPKILNTKLVLSKVERFSILNTLPIPTDPFGDLEAIAHF